MKQIKKTNRGWRLLSMLPLAGLLAAGLGFATPALAAPDLQVRVWVDANSVHQNANHTYNFTIRGQVKNIGNADYVSRNNQQVLFLHQVGRSNHITNWHFSRLNRGQVKNVHVPVINQPGGEFVPSYELALSFDPDIYLDKNPANDDRNRRNNQATLSNQTLSGAFARASSGVRDVQVRPVVQHPGSIRTKPLFNPIRTKPILNSRGKKPDLIPVVINVNRGSIKVKNIGNATAGSSKLSVVCSVRVRGGHTIPCATGLRLRNYDAAHNTLVYRIPALRPGASHALQLFGPRGFSFLQGIYGIKLFADSKQRVAESNEKNNYTRLTIKGKPIFSPKPHIKKFR